MLCVGGFQVDEVRRVLTPLLGQKHELECVTDGKVTNPFVCLFIYSREDHYYFLSFPLFVCFLFCVFMLFYFCFSIVFVAFVFSCFLTGVVLPLAPPTGQTGLVPGEDVSVSKPDHWLCPPRTRSRFRVELQQRTCLWPWGSTVLPANRSPARGRSL